MLYQARNARPALCSNGTAPISLETDQTVRYELQQLLGTLERAFGQPFSLVDCTSGRTIQSDSNALPFQLGNRLALCEQIAERGRPEFLEDVAPLLLLAVPIPNHQGETTLVAISAFITQHVESESHIAAASKALGIEPGQAYRWAQAQAPWHPRALLEVAQALVENSALRQSNIEMKLQLADLSSHVLSTYEEITLLHRLTEQLSISKSVTDLCRMSVAWLSDVIPAKCVAIWLNSLSDLHDQAALQQGIEEQPVLICHGDCPIDGHEFERFIERLGPRVASDSLVLNRAATSFPTWFYPEAREIISVPIREGQRQFGWLFAINHTGAGDVSNSEVEFGTVEASLMASVATILGIHSGNISLYHEQSEFFASMVRALTSAIDAKDEYTCGHSDRVARLSVCLARQMGCSKEELNTIYLSGLLHDIGKIGIDDNVLRKPGPLTPAEIEHIKTHPELGCRILEGVKQLDQVLPVVRHHHEAWDGSGYPDQLMGDECPYLARIVAVADSIDAMSSDRPYRKGIPDDRLDAILRDGAGKQWDPKIIEAAFSVRDELRRIGQMERKPLGLDVEHWQHETTRPLAVF